MFKGSVTPIIVGDLYLPNICWDSDVYEQLDSSAVTKTFLDFARDNAFYQFVLSPTRHSVLTGTSSILDLVLCPDKYAVHDVFTAAPFSTSDHNVVNFKIVSCSHDAS